MSYVRWIILALMAVIFIGFLYLVLSSGHTVAPPPV
ncbi:sensor domain CHASE-containing protein [Rhizobium tibeticum]|nr:sensor domain CHASE-containing protein [Rhizobium tibeticum]